MNHNCICDIQFLNIYYNINFVKQKDDKKNQDIYKKKKYQKKGCKEFVFLIKKVSKMK